MSDVFTFGNLKTEEEEKEEEAWASKAVLAHDGKEHGCVLFHVGLSIAQEIDDVGNSISDLGLGDAPVGISIWEGSYTTLKHDSPDYGTDYSTEANGIFRPPTEEEWAVIKKNESPWEESR